MLAAYAEKYIGKPVIIENLEGGSGSIGWTALSQAAPDGYTLGFINLPNFNATISEGLATYTVDSFAPICNHVTETSVVLVKADSQFNTLEDLVKFAKDNPGKLKASTNGNRASNTSVRRFWLLLPALNIPTFLTAAPPTSCWRSVRARWTSPWPR